MKPFFEYDFKTTLINRAEIEKVLGIPIVLNKEKQDGHRAVEIDQTKNYDNEDIKQVVTAKDEEIAKLKAEIENLLKSIDQSKSAVDYKKHSIHGHFSDNFEVLFKISKLIAEKCDPDNPHSYPNKEQIREHVKTYYSDSKELADAFYKIIIPEKVKNRGRPPQGVETFKGF